MSSPADWHPDPTGRHEHRYWDGQRWTHHVADAGVASTDPLDPSEGGDPAASDTAVSRDANQTSHHDREQTTTSAMPPIEEDTPGPEASEPRQPASFDPPSAPAYGTSSQGASNSGASAGWASMPTAAPVAEPSGGSNPLALVGMILGIASIVLSFLGLLNRFAGIVMFLVAIAAIVLGAMGKSRVKHVGKGNGMAITAIVTGIIGLIAVGLFFAFGEFWRAFSGEFTDLVQCIEETGDEEFCQDQFERRILERVE